MRTFELDVARCVQGEGPGRIASTIPALQNELRPPKQNRGGFAGSQQRSVRSHRTVIDRLWRHAGDATPDPCSADR